MALPRARDRELETPIARPGVAAVEPSTAPKATQQSRLPPETAALPWPQPPVHEFGEWEAFAHFPNFWEGHILAGLLRNEGMPAAVEFSWPGADLMSHSVVWVPRELVHRARWILSWPAPTEPELTFHATGLWDAPPEDAA